MFVAGHEDGGLLGTHERLVEVLSDRVYLLQAFNLFSLARSEHGASSQSAVCVQPNALLVADVLDVVQRVDGSEDGGADGRVDHDGDVAQFDAFLDEAFQFTGDHETFAVCWHVDNVLASDAHHNCTLFDGVVRSLTGEDNHLRQLLDSVVLGIGELVEAGAEDGVEIGERSSGSEESVDLGPLQVAAVDLLDELVFHQAEHGRHLVGGHDCVEVGGHHVSDDCVHVVAGVQLVMEVLVAAHDRLRQDVLHVLDNLVALHGFVLGGQVQLLGKFRRFQDVGDAHVVFLAVLNLTADDQVDFG